MAVAGDEVSVLRVELDLLVIKADGIGREDIEVPLVARMALAIAGSGFGSGLGQDQGQGQGQGQFKARLKRDGRLMNLTSQS